MADLESLGVPIETPIITRCSRCSGVDFRIPENPKPDDQVMCAGCGAVGRYGDLQASALNQTAEHGMAEVKDILRRAGFEISEK